MKLKRLTKVVNEGMYGEPIYVGSYGNIVDLGNNQATSLVHDKLGQLEDIEEELGIDLITLFKALRRGVIWVREHNTKDKEKVPEEITFDFIHHSLRFRHPRAEIGKARNLLDYKKSWALKEDELE